jgi:hypothetical protein
VPTALDAAIGEAHPRQFVSRLFLQGEEVLLSIYRRAKRGRNRTPELALKRELKKPSILGILHFEPNAKMISVLQKRIDRRIPSA